MVLPLTVNGCYTCNKVYYPVHGGNKMALHSIPKINKRAASQLTAAYCYNYMNGPHSSC